MIEILSLHQSQIIRVDGRLKLAAITAWGLFFVALLNGWLFYNQTNATRTEAQRASYEQWVNQPKKNAHSAAHYGFYAYKPLSVVAIMDKGLEDFLGSALWMEAHNQNEVKVRAVQDATFLSRFGDLSVGFVWVILFPIIIILFSFNAISAEREQGTLKMLLVAGISKFDLIKAKFQAIYKSVLGIFLPTFLLLNVLLLAVNPSDYILHIPHLLMVMILLALYFAFFTLVGVGVSGLARSSGYALFSLLGAWVFICFIVPRFNALIAKKTYSTTTAFVFSNEMRKESGVGAKERSKALKDKYLAMYKVDSVQNLPINFVGIELAEGEKHGDEIHEKYYGKLFTTFENQDKIIAFGAIFSPVIAMRNITMAMAGTDNDKEIQFAHQAETHRRIIQKTMNDNIVSAKKESKLEIPMAETALWTKVPQFQYQEVPFFKTMLNQWLNLLVLIVWVVLAWIILKKISHKISI